MMNKMGIIIAGTIREGRHQQDHIISSEGICRCLVAGSHMNAEWMNLIAEVRYEQQKAGDAPHE